MRCAPAPVAASSRGSEPRSCREVEGSRSSWRVPSQLEVGKTGADVPQSLHEQLARTGDSQLGPEESWCWDPQSSRSIPTPPGPRTGPN